MEIVIKLVEKKFVEIEGALFEIPEGCKWVAVDRDGSVWAFYNEPYVVTSLRVWLRDGQFIGCTHSAQPDWQNMVVEVN